MNWKQLLYKGLPVFVIAAIIVIIAVIAGRPKPQPKLSSDIANDLVVDFKGLKVTNSDLYGMMKYNNGLDTLLNQIDTTLLKAKYEDKIDSAALNDEIAKDKADDETAFYNKMITLGVINSVDQADRDQKIKDYYLIQYLQKAYAKEQAVDDLVKNRATDVQKAMDDVKTYRDFCVIPLKYNTKTEAQTAATELKALSGAALKTEFINRYNAQKAQDTSTTTTTTPDTFFKDFSCDYQLVVYKTATQDFRNLVFNNTYTVGEYNQTPQFADSYYYLVYKNSQAPAVTDSQLDALKQYVTDQLIADTVTQSYVTKEMNSLHSSMNLKIYDPEIAKLYAAKEPGFKVSKYKNRTTVATYNDLDGNKQTVTTDTLYTELSKEYALQSMLDLVNYQALASINGIQLSTKELNDIKDQINTIKTNFLASGQAKTMTWMEYLKSYGIFSESQLSNQFSIDKLKDRYILGYTVDNTVKYAGVDPVTDEQVQTSINEYFKYQASHILITFGENSINPAGRDKDVAQKMATQIIEGCSEADVDNDTCYITVKDADGVDQPFDGLNNTKGTDLPKVFADLASRYSEDTGSKDKGGDLGYFGPGQMVKAFEDKAKEIVKNNWVFSDAPVETTIPTQTETLHGFHVIYITGVMPTTPKPAGYDDIADPSKSTDKAVTDYYNFVQTIRSSLENERKQTDYVEKKLAELRVSSGFKFLDEKIQEHYTAVNNLKLNPPTK